MDFKRRLNVCPNTTCQSNRIYFVIVNVLLILLDAPTDMSFYRCS